jgi:23S rRNA (adenine2030-N6)-methyltransferase
MNYRHAFHAGNFGDVLKHVVLLELLDALHRKPNPVHLIDTHAGIGLYDLASDEAMRSGEYRFGIGAVLADMAAAKQLPRYVDALKRLNPELKPGGSGLRRYPGSPWLLQDSVRSGDRVTLCELHPQDADTLKHNIGRDPAVAIHHRDGFEAIKALTPPTPRRGLALIDPAFELKNEFETLTKAVLLAQQRWATGQLAVWYPIKDQKKHRELEKRSGEAAEIGNAVHRADRASGERRQADERQRPAGDQSALAAGRRAGADAGFPEKPPDP